MYTKGTVLRPKGTKCGLRNPFVYFSNKEMEASRSPFLIKKLTN